MKNFIRHVEDFDDVELVEASTLTEDGYRISGFGTSQKEALDDAHTKAQTYGDYDYPVHETVSGEGEDPDFLNDNLMLDNNPFEDWSQL